MTTLKSTTKSIDINISEEKVFEFLNNPLNWPQWAVVNLKSVSIGKEGWYEMETRQGQGELKMFSSKQYGVLDHQWKNAETCWMVPSRVVANGDNSTFIITFFQPATISDELFNELMREIEIELTTLKKVLES